MGIRVAILSSTFFHDAKEVTRMVDGKPVQGQDKIVFGGAERYLIDLCTMLMEDGHTVTVYQPFYGTPKVFSKKYKGITFVCMPGNAWDMNTCADLNWQFNEYSALDHLRIYFCTFLAYPNALSPCITISHGIFWDNTQGANTVQQMDEAKRREFFKRQLYGFTAPDVVVSVDSNVRKTLAALEPGSERKTHIIYNYVDTKVFTPAPKTWEGINVLFPRRLTTLRGSTEVTKAFINLPQYNFTLAGQAWDSAAADAFFKSHEHRKNVKFLHREMDGMAEVYQYADISLVPTISTEGLSLSLLESMACGLPVITTPVGGLGDAVIDSYNALIYDPNHEDICDYITALAEDEETRIKFGKRNREIAVECFDIEIWKARWRNLLAQFGAVPEKQYPAKIDTRPDNSEPGIQLPGSNLPPVKELPRELTKKEWDEHFDKPKKPKLVAMMLTHNEACRYLERVIENTLLFCDEIVILDDHSTDGTVNLLYGGESGKKFKNKFHLFDAKNTWENESKLRQELLEKALAYNPDWLIAIDADELYEADKMNEQLPRLMSQTDADWIGFRFYDMWDDENYRDDDIWPAGTSYFPRMFRVNQNEDYTLPDMKRHCGSVPEQVFKHSGIRSSIRVKHLGWAKNEDRDRKYLQRVTEDPDSSIFPRKIYDAILDTNPTLVKWDDNNPWQTSKLTIAYPPCMHWNVMQQRPHHLLKLAANERYRVFFGDVSISNDYEVMPYLNLVKEWDSVKEVDIAYITSFTQLKYLKDIKYKTLIYDCVDFFSTDDVKFIEKADYVLCASQMIYDRAYSIIKNKILKDCFPKDWRNVPHSDLNKVLYIPNACEPEHWSSVESPKFGDVVGYIGVVTEDLNLEVINAIAEKYKVILIGEQKCDLKLSGNVKAVGHVHYNDLPGIMSTIKVAIRPIDIKRNYTLYQAPVKIFEYLSAGRPVVASPIPELEPLAEMGLIKLVPTDDTHGWVKAVDEAMNEYPNTKGIDWAKEQTWDKRWLQIKEGCGLK
jgi:glycosyltransferase involved in cell wall biosynthesis